MMPGRFTGGPQGGEAGKCDGAQRNLGGMHLRGEGVPEDYARAYAWSSISAAGGSARSKKGKNLSPNA
jgi:TPR repeat protein